MIEYIGGFFELDEFKNGNGPYHHEGLALTNGRACFHAILREISPSHLYLPYYCCDSLLYVIHEHNISFSFYSINSNFEMTSPPALKSTEWLLYINYFGLKTDYIQSIYDQYSGHIIIDNVQAFFETSFNQSWSFNSARKFFGVPDGAYLFSPSTLTIDTKPQTKISMAHLIHRLHGEQAIAFEKFKRFESSLSSNICVMSDISKNILSAIPYHHIMQHRRHMFQYLHNALNELNQLNLTATFKDNQTPMAYPFLPTREMKRSNFHQKNIFIPTIWPLHRYSNPNKYRIETQLKDQLLPLPIDHRITKRNCDKIIKLIIDDQRS